MDTRLNSFKSDRRFSVFSYGISHGPLLLRSGKTNEHLTRIDVLILDVRAMEIRSWFDGIEITRVGQDYLRLFRSNPIELMEAGLSVYALSGEGWQGFVLGGELHMREDDGDFAAPSALLLQRLVPEQPPSLASKTNTNEPPFPDDCEIEAAARVLFNEGSFHHWWPSFKNSYDEFVATDQIGKEEFDAIVERILFAATKARLRGTP